MPYAIQLTYRARRLRIHAERQPLWRRLHAIAERATGGLVALWAGLLRDFRQGFSLKEVREALASGGMLGTETLLRDTWEMTVDEPARRLLPLLVEEITTESAQESIPALADLAGVTEVPYTPHLPTTQQGIAVYVGTQARQIGQTTLLAVRQTLRTGIQGDLPLPALARLVRQVAGLTPTQAERLQARAMQLRAEGQSVRESAPLLEEAAQRGLALRARAIAETQSMGSVNLGVQEALTQTTQRGVLPAQLVRRFWEVTPPDVCERCLAIAALNEGGVGLDEPFQTPGGALMTPPTHVRCKCIVRIGVA